jgi:hypothetical protein
VPTPQESKETGLLKLAALAYCQSADREFIILFEVKEPQRLTHQGLRDVFTLSANEQFPITNCQLPPTRVTSHYPMNLADKSLVSPNSPLDLPSFAKPGNSDT